MKNPEIEFASTEQIRLFQEEKLRQHLSYLNKKSPYYQRLFANHAIDVKEIRGLADLQKIPYTEKTDLQKYNRDFICVSPDQIIDYITTSGTLSEPTTFALNEADLDRLAYNEAISFLCADFQKGDIYQLMTTIDKRFMAGLAYFLGIRKLGGGIIRVGNGIPELQWDSIFRMRPNAIIVVPSFILKIIQYAEANGIDYQNSGVKKAICIGENIREQDFSLNLLGQRIKEKWDIELYSTYASTEMATTFTECRFQQGGHHHPDLMIIELVDENGKNVPRGTYGELVVTPLGVKAMPLLRFKTGDICRFHEESCPCGRNTIRIGPIVGRKNQMIKFKGTTLYPYAIFDVLDNLSAVENYIVELTTNACGMDDLIIHVGCLQPSENFEKELKDKFRAKLRVAPEIVFKPIQEIQKEQISESMRKARKFIDNRKYDTNKYL